MSFQIKVTNIDRTIECPENRTILSAAIAAGIDFPYGCATGNCGMCMSSIRSGSVELLPYSDGALRPAQQERGQTLACRAQPRSDVEIKWLGSTKLW